MSLTKTEAAYLALREGIEGGSLQPGARLRIDALKEELGMSATPVREALRMLQADGLVTHEPHRGMGVAQFSIEDTREVYRLRALLEPLATELAVGRADERARAEIRAVHARLVESVGS